MNWDDLRFILAVSRGGTLLAGAEALKVSPTTVSRRLRALEADLGTSLFDKLTHGTQLSDAGSKVLAVAEEVEKMTDLLDAELHGLDQKLEGQIRVTSVDFILRSWVTDFAKFRQKYPHVELELTSTTSVVNLTQREADVAIRVAPRAPEHLVGAKHAEFMYAIYGGAQLVKSKAKHATYNDYPWLSWDLSFARSTDKWIEDHAPDAAIALRLGNMNIMVDAIAANLGVTILPCFIGDAHPNLRRVGNYFEGGLYLWVLTHPQLKNAARIRSFTSYVRELIRRDKDLIEGRRYSF